MHPSSSALQSYLSWAIRYARGRSDSPFLGNKSFDASIPDWALDADVRALMQKRDQCTRLPIAAVWYDKWSDYTDAEKHTTLELVQSFVRQQITMALFDLHLLPT
jgi:hypothetical protein